MKREKSKKFALFSKFTKEILTFSKKAEKWRDYVILGNG